MTEEIEIIEDKAAFRAHVRLIMQQDDLPENDARFRAWLEGPKGYVRRKGTDRKGGAK